MIVAAPPQSETDFNTRNYVVAPRISSGNREGARSRAMNLLQRLDVVTEKPIREESGLYIYLFKEAFNFFMVVSHDQAQVIITFENSDYNDERLQETTTVVLEQIKEVRGVEEANLVAVEGIFIPEGAKSFGGYLLGSLRTIVSRANLSNLIKFLGKIFFGGTIKISIKTSEKEITIEANSYKDLLAAEETIKRLL